MEKGYVTDNDIVFLSDLNLIYTNKQKYGASISLDDSTATLPISSGGTGVNTLEDLVTLVLKLDGSWDYPITVRSQSTNPVLLLGSDSQPDTGISELNYTGISWDGDTTTCAISGTVNASGFYESSDENIKSNISNIEKSAKGIELKLFTFNSDKDTVKYGVIAQLLEEIGLDNLVSTDKLGLKSVDYISMLVLCIQDLRNEISDLKKLLGNL